MEEENQQPKDKKGMNQRKFKVQGKGEVNWKRTGQFYWNHTHWYFKQY